MSKMISIKVAHFLFYGEGSADHKSGEPRYKVITVKNSTLYSPGQELVRGEVDDLCRNGRYDVTVVSLDPAKGGV